MDSRADGIIQRFDRLKGDRGTHEATWQKLGELVLPMRADFTVKNTPGGKRGQSSYDGTAGRGQRNLASGLYGMITNPANNWFAIKAADDGLMKLQPVALWCETVTEAMRNALLADGMRFYSRLPGLYQDLVTFGTAVFYVEENVGKGGLYFSHRHLAECVIDQSAQEEVDTVIRRFTWTARQAMQRWGRNAGTRASDAVARGNMEEPCTYLHAIMPREDLDLRRADAKGMPWASVYIDVETRAVVAEGGYHELPIMAPRWDTATGSVYGEGPAALALADTQMLNAMAKTTLIAAQKQVDPPLLVWDELTARGIKTMPGGLNYGGVDAAGRPMIQPLVTGGRVELGLQMEEARRQAILDAFHYTLLLTANVPGRTATEVLQLQEEKLRLMAPNLGRVQSELLDPLLDRVFGILFRAGSFPPVPPEFAAAGAPLRIDYVSPLARAAKVSEAVAVQRFLESVQGLAQIDPSVADNVDPDAAARAIADAHGVPAKVLRDPKDVERLRQQRQQAQQQQQLMAAAQAAAPLAGAAKTVMEARQIARQEAQP